jgi:Mg2+-importing ATPase
VVLIGLILPFTPLAFMLGFVSLPGAYFVFLGGATMTYLLLVEAVKRRLMRTLLGMSPAPSEPEAVTPASSVS